MVETVVEAIRINVVTEQHVVILKELAGTRVIPIWIGRDVAEAIALELQRAQIGRPMTHDLLRSVIRELGGEIGRVVVNDLRDQTFYAEIEIVVDGRSVNVDSRPSDAIALAVRAQAPIFVEEHVMDQAGLVLPSEATEEPGEQVQQEESIDNESLSVFRDFINSMDLDDPKRESE